MYIFTYFCGLIVSADLDIILKDIDESNTAELNSWEKTRGRASRHLASFSELNRLLNTESYGFYTVRHADT